MELFAFHQNTTSILIEIGKEINQQPHNTAGKRANGQAMRNSVQFHYLGLNLNDSFQAISAVSSLVQIYIHRQFSQHGNRASTRLFNGENIHDFFVAKISHQDGRLPGLILGLENPKLQIQMSQIASIRRFDNALKKAANWISPWPTIL